MMDDELAPACSAARQWLSAHRDGEALDDVRARGHLNRCSACAAWARALDALTPRLRLRTAGSPDVAAAAVAAWRRRQTAGAGRAAAAGRLLAAAAGVSGLAAAVIRLALLPAGPWRAEAHAGWELHSFEAVLAVGFLLAAYRPARYSRALLPLVAGVAVLVLVPSGAELAVSAGAAFDEAAHLPVLVGLAGLALLTVAEAGGVPAEHRDGLAGP